MFRFDASKGKADPPKPMFITVKDEQQLNETSPRLQKKVHVKSLVGEMAALTIGLP